MKIRLGYACISDTLKVTPSSTVTYTNFSKTNDYEHLKKVIISNFLDLEKIIDYNIKNDITFFRLTSKLIPLATKDDVIFDYLDEFDKYYKTLSKKVKPLRVDMHPDQFTVLNSVKEEVIKNSIENLEYHYKILDKLDIKEKVLILHVGSSVFGKEKSITRFINEFKKLPKHLQKSIVIENDDKVYNVEDCLKICESLNIPMVLDYHHHICNHTEFDINLYMKRIISTWDNKKIKPKMHFSSPKSKLKKEKRTHHDYIDVIEFMKFLNILKTYNADIDIMLESKKKDESLFKLLRLLKYYDYKVINNEIII